MRGPQLRQPSGLWACSAGIPMPSHGSSTEFRGGKERPHFCLGKQRNGFPREVRLLPKQDSPGSAGAGKNNFPQVMSSAIQRIDGKQRRRALSRSRLVPGPPAPQSLASRDRVWHPGDTYPSLAGTSHWSHMVTRASSHSAHLFINFVILELLVFHLGKLVLLSSG